MQPHTSGKKIIIGVTGGIAAYKTAMLVSRLVQSDFTVQVVASISAFEFVGNATWAALSGRPVVTDLFDPGFPLGPHIELPREFERMCVAPATANFLAKAAAGLADDLLSTLVLGFTGPIILAPAMNCEMWEKPAVQRNIQTLKDDGFQMVGPNEGWLSCRVKGQGRMAEPDEILAAIGNADHSV